MKRLLLILAAAIISPSCILNVLDTSDRLNYRGEVLIDTQKNRSFMTASYERTLMQENGDVSPPPAYSSWDAVWSSIFKTLRNGETENPEFYINYIKQRRKELGLPRR